MKGECCAPDGLVIGFGTDDPDMGVQSVANGPLLMGCCGGGPVMVFHNGWVLCFPVNAGFDRSIYLNWFPEGNVFAGTCDGI